MGYRMLFLVALLFWGCNAQNSGEAGSENAGTADGTAPASMTSNRDLESPDFSIQAEGVPQGTGYLVAFFCETQFIVDSAVVNASGEISFKREQPYNPGIYVAVMPSQTANIQFILDADQTFSLSTQAADPVNAMQVDGSLENELFYENLQFEANIQPRLDQVANAIRQAGPSSPEYSNFKAQQDALVAERKQHLQSLFEQAPNSLFTKFKKAGQNPDIQDVRKPDGTVDAQKQVDLYKQDFWNDVDFQDERLLYTPVIFNKLRRYMQQLTAQNPDAIISSADDLLQKVPPKSACYKFFTNWIAATFEPGTVSIMDAEAIYVHMVKNYFIAEKAFWLEPAQVQGLQMRADEMSYSLVGQKGPNIKVPGVDGKIKELYDLKSDYIIVFMYNPDCDHCQEETPVLRNFYNGWKTQGVSVEVYAVAIDTEDALWKKFIQDYQIGEWVNVFDPTNRSIYKTYFVDNTPELYVLNKDRVIIGKNLKPFQVPDVIRMDQQK
jgi:peroxiredoxin